MDVGEEEVYDEADAAEQGEGEVEEGGFDEDELDSALADVQGASCCSPAHFCAVSSAEAANHPI